jgi:hypothetical protein
VEQHAECKSVPNRWLTRWTSIWENVRPSSDSRWRSPQIPRA